ncbi:hypothetical protein KQX54_001776 [Cotesia glomerata]|uniref:Uncharacterized protein n=1 Tax=Cotesia glomerata TaxID=32391 RepID=A0AAV7IC48_COTGL|nr:hypothetical protein KQX54_001776 [Cotesia glomerata]
MNSNSRFQDKTVSSIIKRDDETSTSNNSVKNFSIKYKQCPNELDEDPNDPNYEVGDSEDLDYDSESSDSHISELEELDDFEEPEDSRKDSIVRHDFDASADLDYNLSSIQLDESRVSNLDMDSNDKQNEVFDDEQVSEPLLFDNSPVAPNLNELQVSETGKKAKKTFCCFCLQLKAVPSRHYRDVHSNEKEVKKFLAMKKNSVERKTAIEKLRLRGNNIYNLNRDFNKGKLLVCWQPRKSSVENVIYYKPCSKCGRW